MNLQNYIPEFVQKIIVISLCGFLPGILFIAGGIRHWRKKEITSVGGGKSLNFHWAKVITTKGDSVRYDAMTEIGLGCFILFISAVSAFAPILVDWLNKAPSSTSLSRQALLHILITAFGFIPGLSLVIAGTWMFFKKKAIRFSHNNSKNILKWWKTIEGESARAEAGGYILLGALFLIFSLLFY